jgi:hypothetical protein
MNGVPSVVYMQQYVAAAISGIVGITNPLTENIDGAGTYGITNARDPVALSDGQTLGGSYTTLFNWPQSPNSYGGIADLGTNLLTNAKDPGDGSPGSGNLRDIPTVQWTTTLANYVKSLWSTQFAVQNVDMNGFRITFMQDPTSSTDAATKSYVDTTTSFVAAQWSTYGAISDVNMTSHKVSNLSDPVATQDAATKTYVDSKVSSTVTVSVSEGNDATTFTVTHPTLPFPYGILAVLDYSAFMPTGTGTIQTLHFNLPSAQNFLYDTPYSVYAEYQTNTEPAYGVTAPSGSLITAIPDVQVFGGQNVVTGFTIKLTNIVTQPVTTWIDYIQVSIRASALYP